MLVALVSDSHDHLGRIAQAVEQIRVRGAEAVIHGGDWVAPFAAKAWLAADVPTMGVFGNNDGEKAGLSKVVTEVYEAPHVFAIGGRSILACHDVEDVPEAQAGDVDLVLVGHSHRNTTERRGGVLLVNPGEVCGWVTGEATMAFVDLDTMDVEVVEL